MHKRSGEAASQPVVSLRGVTKSFDGLTVLQDIDLTVMKGEIFGFLGPNGAGKTTTIKLLLDILRPTAGTIELFGVSNRLTATTHRRLGYLSGDMILDDDLTGRQYLEFVSNQYGGDQAAMAARRDQLAMQLKADLSPKIGKYSRGNKQKIGLIAALMHQPELLVLDEPSSGFDPLIQEVFMRLVQDYRQAGGTVLMSSHTLSEVQRLCDRVAFIRAGRIVGLADVDQLNRASSKRVKASGPKTQIAALTRGAGRLPGLKLLETTPTRLSFSFAGDIQLLLRLLADYHLDDLTIQEPDLEEIFMTYYQGEAL